MVSERSLLTDTERLTLNAVEEFCVPLVPWAYCGAALSRDDTLRDEPTAESVHVGPADTGRETTV